MLGVGGMGSVYKARDTLLDRFVALKLLRTDLSSGKDHPSRFQHEARIAASVNHPNVIRVFSSGTDHGQFYVVMELVDHGSLDDLIEKRKQLPEQQVLECGIQVARGLRAAHQQGLIHRDVKPANILFADEHTAKISDFGLAGVAGEGSEAGAEIWGTPYYVAPVVCSPAKSVAKLLHLRRASAWSSPPSRCCGVPREISTHLGGASSPRQSERNLSARVIFTHALAIVDFSARLFSSSSHGTKPATISFTGRTESQDHGVHETELRRAGCSHDFCGTGAPRCR